MTRWRFVSTCGRSRLLSNCSNGFTLLELLVVMAILAVLAVAIVPAVGPLSKSSGRKGAVNELLGVIEQARAQALRDGQPTYVVFSTQLPGAPGKDVIQKYNFRAFAIFEDDPANPGSTKQVTGWRTLPTGFSIRSGSLNYLAASNFAFTPMGSNSIGKFRYLKFETDGGIDAVSTPSSSTGTINFGIFEGYVDGSPNDVDTNSKKPTENVVLTRVTGRAEYQP